MLRTHRRNFRDRDNNHRSLGCAPCFAEAAARAVAEAALEVASAFGIAMLDLPKDPALDLRVRRNSTGTRLARQMER
jgi:hypothetical protein